MRGFEKERIGDTDAGGAHGYADHVHGGDSFAATSEYPPIASRECGGL
jgi:hypothetical protein